MGEAKRDDKKKSMEYFGGKADNLDQKTMAYLQGFIACAEQMANKKEDKKNEGPNPNDTDRG